MNDLRNVDRVIDGLYIGNAAAMNEAHALHRHGVQRVLKLYFDRPYWPRSFTVLENAVVDGMPLPRHYLDTGMAFLHASMSAQEPVLVACRMGVSRSSTFVLAYLLERGYDLLAAWELLLRQHPRAWPATAMWESLLEHYDT
ncbi:MAG: dual specificity protein phosphatase family protein, partial [Anaerolineae bacterium]|nr:dual specificity protein phosphatase family protein [Anaerolineae bacterium]